jgi:hypothetical protein
MAALAAVEIEDLGTAKTDRRREAQLERELAAARAWIELLEREHRKLNSRLAEIAALAAGTAPAIVTDLSHEEPRPKIERKPARTIRLVTSNVAAASGDSLHPAARKLLLALAQDAPARFTWGQAATLAGLKPSGGHFNAGRKDLRILQYVAETNGLVTPTPLG